jgi:heme-degrading monooxygenase HmoA
MRTRVMVYAHIRNEDRDAFEAAYAEVTAKVKGTPGHVRDELLRHSTGDDVMPGAEADPDPDGVTSYILLSEWERREDFLGWERDEIHMQTTTPMRPYWVGRVRRHIYDVAHRLGD